MLQPDIVVRMAMDMKVVVGTNMRRLRKRLGLTQAEAAEVTGLTQQYLSSMEGGAINPTLTTLSVVAKAFGVEVSDLVSVRPPED